MADDSEWFLRSRKWVLDVFRDDKVKKDRANLFAAVRLGPERSAFLKNLHPAILTWLQLRGQPASATEWASCVKALDGFTLPSHPRPPHAAAASAGGCQAQEALLPRGEPKIVLPPPGEARVMAGAKGQFDSFLRAPPRPVYGPSASIYATDAAEIQAELSRVFIKCSAIANESRCRLLLPRTTTTASRYQWLVRRNQDERVGAILAEWSAEAWAYDFKTTQESREAPKLAFATLGALETYLSSRLALLA